MLRKTALISGVLCFSASGLFADFTYEQNAKVTGGALAGMLKFAGAFSKNAREAGNMNTTTIVKGNKMAHISQQHMSITDLDTETITDVDMAKKQYSVITFADMKKALQQMAEKASQRRNASDTDTEVNFKVSVDKTGEKKNINGFDASEAIMKLAMEGTDQKTGQTGAMTITNDMWLAPNVAGYDEVKSFYRRMAEKLGWGGTGIPLQDALMRQNPKAGQGMADMVKEVSKLDGIPVYQVMKVGGEGTGAQAGNGGAPPAERPSAGEAAGDAGGSMLGRKLGGGLGGLAGGALGGGFGRKKKQKQEEQQASAPPSSGDASASLIEMTMEMTTFSSAPVDASRFAIPAGFKQVQHPMEKLARE